MTLSMMRILSLLFGQVMPASRTAHCAKMHSPFSIVVIIVAHAVYCVAGPAQLTRWLLQLLVLPKWCVYVIDVIARSKSDLIHQVAQNVDPFFIVHQLQSNTHSASQILAIHMPHLSP